VSGDYERLWEAFNTTLDRTARNRQAVEMERIVSEELPMLMLFHNFHVVAHLSRLQGPDPTALRDLMVWNVHEWELR
jgi:ABC-type transport system substrate-binding protein